MNAPALNQLIRRPLRVDEFLELSDRGAFAEYGKTELIEGDIYVMNAQFSRHARIKSELYYRLRTALDPGLSAVFEVAVRLSDETMVEPDITVSRYRGDREVPAADALLVIEVADTTLDVDLGRKQRLYAAAAIPEYWVVDLEGQQAHLFAKPTDSAYASNRTVAWGQALGSAAITGLVVETVGIR